MWYVHKQVHKGDANQKRHHHGFWARREKHFPWERDNTVNVQKYKTEEVQSEGSKKTNSFRTIYMARKTNGLESLYFISSVQIPLTRLYDLEAVNKLKIYSYYTIL